MRLRPEKSRRGSMNTRIHSVESLEQLRALAGACTPPDIHLVDLGDLLLEGADSELLVQLHASVRAASVVVDWISGLSGATVLSLVSSL